MYQILTFWDNNGLKLPNRMILIKDQKLSLE